MTCSACRTLGDLIVRRASAGAAFADAKRALSLAGRTGTVEQRAAAIEAATGKLAELTATYEAAQRAEEEAASPVVRRGDGQVGPSFLPVVTRAAEAAGDRP